MTLREEIYHDIKDVPENTLQMLHQFVRFLIDSQSAQARDEDVKRVRHGEWVNGEIWMSEDFNDSLEFVSESEIHILDAMREAKQEIAV